MRIFSWIQLLALVLLTALAIIACQSQAEYSIVDSASPLSSTTNDCQTIEHIRGKVQVCGQPQRIVVLGSSVMESLLALDVQPVAYADYMMSPTGNYDLPSQQIPYFGNRITGQLVNLGLTHAPALETILKVQPDLILGTEYNASQYDTLSQIAPTLLLKWTEAQENLKTIAQVLGKSEEAEQLLTERAQQVAAARETFASVVKTNPKVLLLYSGNLQEIYFGNRFFGLCASLVRDLGFELISLPGFDEFNRDARASISIETLPQLNDADLVIMFGSNFSQSEHFNSTNDFEDHQLLNLKQAWQKNAIAQSLNASKSGRVYFIPYYLCAGLPGPIGTEIYLNELRQQLLSPS
ncbi:MAG: iron-siderophore ABC transporter substrate-binding protein [Symploca sp. SIO2E9]|nr:iron-siderophore ABC transporter substrate-binding protein [Symploca sp. SIO2E9]